MATWFDVGMRNSRLVLFAAAAFLLLVGMLAAQSATASPQCQTVVTPSGLPISSLAPWYCNNIDQYVANLWAGWQPIVLIAVFISFSAAGAIFMIGVAMRNERIRNFGIGEIYEATATAIIVVTFMFLSAVVFGVLPAIATGPVDPYPLALSYMSATINATQLNVANVLQAVFVDQFYGSIGITVFNGYLTLGGQVVQTLAASIATFFIIPARAVVYLLGDGLLVVSTQFYLVLFFMYTAIPVFLIPGILFRAIFPVRNLGGIMIAIAIAFYLIMPTLFAITYYFTNTGLIQTLNNYAAQIGINSQGTGSQTNAASPTSPLVTAVQGLQNAMGSYWLSILFYPALIAAISYESIKIIAEFIGGATKTSGRMRAI